MKKWIKSVFETQEPWRYN